MIMKYADVKTPEELLKFMDEHLQYGFKDSDGSLYTLDDDENFEYGVKNLWRLKDSQEIIIDGYGHCFDQTEVERDWFIENGYRVHTLFVMFCLEEENPYTTHSYLVYESQDKYNLFEHADGPRKGILEFDTLKEAVYHQLESHLLINNDIKELSKKEIESLHVFEYSKPPLGVNLFEFYDHVLDNGKEIL